jgi:hypothetical protein
MNSIPVNYFLTSEGGVKIWREKFHLVIAAPSSLLTIQVISLANSADPEVSWTVSVVIKPDKACKTHS